MEFLKPIRQRFAVEYDYTLHFTQDVFGADNPLLYELLKDYSSQGKVKLLAVVDDAVSQAHPDLSDKIAAYGKHFADNMVITEVLVVSGGEKAKVDTAHLNAVLEAIDGNRICRHSFVLAIGGGALVDMVGYAAAIAHRGVKLIRIPTTVLSQNDAAVGVKNSVNIFGKKNFLGTFAPPFAIINDSDFLTTLEKRDWVSGIAEAVKVALIKDATFYGYLEANAKALARREMEPMQYLIHRCAELHMQHIAQGGDPFESGSSRPLDFGHWAAHKLEQLTQYELRHGEAVAIGMALDVTYAHLIGMIDATTLERIKTTLTDSGFELKIPIEKGQEDSLLVGLEEFREHLGGELCITLISEIGKKVDVDTIDKETMKKAMWQLNQWS
ncbi:3-dehydroquinate synthase [Sediminicola luteus]|uniref:3-dehydroquinate synthase n=1 Tax=Sediminicola luteus TaxID=319238 RepID=A0A2A4GB70_9FLAO|nr:3-dehydroquinate synthase [Sediminicola luteus]PCE65002.1 3-dehydroquinate synthase [Sediminicola luteus]